MQHLTHRRVLLLTEAYPPTLGGIQNYLSQLIAQLSPARTFVIAQEQSGGAEWDKEQKYKIVRVNMKGGLLPRWRPALRTLEKAIEEFQPEIIVCGKALFEGRAALKIWKKYRIPYVVMTYGMEVNTWLNGWKTKRDLLKVCEQASRVFVINEETKNTLSALINGAGVDDLVRPREHEDVLPYDIVRKKFVKMYPGVDMFYSIEDNPYKDYPQKSQKTIITVCRLVHRKGVDVVINAVNEIRKTIPNVEYLIIGDGPEKKNLEKLVSGLGLQINVKFFGKLSNEQIREYYQKADLFVMTPRNENGNIEGFGIVYLEAALAGLCAVGSRSGGVSEAILDGQTGLLANEDDVKDTAEKISGLLQNESLRKQLAEQARKRAVDEFSWSKRAVLFRGVVESVVK